MFLLYDLGCLNVRLTMPINPSIVQPLPMYQINHIIREAFANSDYDKVFPCNIYLEGCHYVHSELSLVILTSQHKILVRDVLYLPLRILSQWAQRACS